MPPEFLSIFLHLFVCMNTYTQNMAHVKSEDSLWEGGGSGARTRIVRFGSKFLYQILQPSLLEP